jgi:hypothetical protein
MVTGQLCYPSLDFLILFVFMYMKFLLDTQFLSLTEAIEVQTENAWFLKITQASLFAYCMFNFMLLFNMFTEKSPTSKQRVDGRGSSERSFFS